MEIELVTVDCKGRKLYPDTPSKKIKTNLPICIAHSLSQRARDKKQTHLDFSISTLIDPWPTTNGLIITE